MYEIGPLPVRCWAIVGPENRIITSEKCSSGLPRLLNHVSLRIGDADLGANGLLPDFGTGGIVEKESLSRVAWQVGSVEYGKHIHGNFPPFAKAVMTSRPIKCLASRSSDETIATRLSSGVLGL